MPAVDILTFNRAYFVTLPPIPYLTTCLICKVRADHFDVTLSFLLQQAAWLYERQLSQVREQLRKVNKPPTSARSSPAPDSISGSTNVGGYAMRRGGSGGAEKDHPVGIKLANLHQTLECLPLYLNVRGTAQVHAMKPLERLFGKV